ncbi:MAG: hypothetical protein M3Z15_00115 [Pseudomonadota bacterium]|nr:hypothetical protein [Pseudomonadota bacterium]
MARYNVVSIDNASIGLGGQRVDRGEFESAEAAIGRAKQLVDAALLEYFKEASSAQQLMDHYMRKGSEVPMIYGEPRVAFHAYQYARERANAMFEAARD